MHPILMEIGSFPLYTYGLILALAISSGLAMAGYLAHRRGWPALEVVDIGLWSTLIGLVGARLGFILQRPELFRDNWWQVLNFRAGGITIIGALIFGNLALILLCRRYRFSPWFCLICRSANFNNSSFSEDDNFLLVIKLLTTPLVLASNFSLSLSATVCC